MDILHDNISTKCELDKYEMYYILQYSSNDLKFGYNMTSGGEGGDT